MELDANTATGVDADCNADTNADINAWADVGRNVYKKSPTALQSRIISISRDSLSPPSLYHHQSVDIWQTPYFLQSGHS